jgi:sugar phosphate isomerase/epimerase
MAETDPRMPLGVTAVMLPELDLQQQISLCVELGVTHYTLRPRIIRPEQREQPYSNWGNHKFDLTPQRLRQEGAQLHQQLTEAGLVPFGTVPGAKVSDDDETLREHFEGAAAAGAGRVRLAPLPYPQDRPFDYADLLQRSVEGYQRAVELAKPLGITLVIETHAFSLATSPGLAWNIVRHFDPADVSVIFDLPNFAREGGVQPMLAVSVLGRWIDHVHIGGFRRTFGGYDEGGFRQPGGTMCPIPDSDLHLPQWIAALRQLGRSLPMVIEDYTPNMPGALRLRESARAVKRLLAVTPPGGA